MIINDTEISLILKITDLSNENEIVEKSFQDFEELNEELRNPSFEEPLDSEIELIVCEKLEEEEVILFGYYISYLELDQEEISEYMDDIREYLQPGGVQLTPVIEDSDPRKEMKKEAKLARYEYVCPRCFETIQNCTCSSYPYYLVQIDKNILPIIKGLNLKGYYTAASCEGHEEETNRSTEIIFKDKYHFPIYFPEGGHYTAQGILRYTYNEGDVKTYRKKKEEILEALLKWSLSLPNRMG